MSTKMSWIVSIKEVGAGSYNLPTYFFRTVATVRASTVQEARSLAAHRTGYAVRDLFARPEPFFCRHPRG